MVIGYQMLNYFSEIIFKLRFLLHTDSHTTNTKRYNYSKNCNLCVAILKLKRLSSGNIEIDFLS